MNIIKKYFNLSLEQECKFAKLQKIYSEWNKKVNLISRIDIDNIYERHILHSLSIAKIIQFKKNTQILDAGTGGGFPGIPLAIMFPESFFLLADSIGKKINTVNAIINELELKNVKAIQKRVENIEDKFDFVVSRAVTELPEFYRWVYDKIEPEGFNDLPNGILYLKGGDVEKEMEKVKDMKSVAGKKQLAVEWRTYNLSDYFEEVFFQTKKIVYIC